MKVSNMACTLMSSWKLVIAGFNLSPFNLTTVVPHTHTHTHRIYFQLGCKQTEVSTHLATVAAHSADHTKSMQVQPGNNLPPMQQQITRHSARCMAQAHLPIYTDYKSSGISTWHCHRCQHSPTYTVKLSEYPLIFLRRVFHILTELVPYAFVYVNWPIHYSVDLRIQT